MSSALFAVLITWLICLVLHWFAGYLDWELPVKQEARYKKQIEKKYGAESMKDSRKMVGLESMTEEILKDKAVKYARGILKAFSLNSKLSGNQYNELLEYYKNYYIEKHKNLL